MSKGTLQCCLRKIPLATSVQGGLERARMEEGSTGGGQGRDLGGKAQGWTRTGLWGGVEEVDEREECERTLGLGLRGKGREGGAGTEVV